MNEELKPSKEITIIHQFLDEMKFRLEDEDFEHCGMNTVYSGIKIGLQEARELMVNLLEGYNEY